MKKTSNPHASGKIKEEKEKMKEKHQRSNDEEK